MDDTQKTIEKIKNFLSENSLKIKNKDLLFARCFNEAWFSNTLAWLLDPKGSHNLGVNFANEFLQRIARIRTEGSKNKYKTKGTLLKWGKTGKGRSSFGFSLKNAAVIREFYLTRSTRKRNGRSPKFCDIVFFDMDSSDGLFLVIENKLFSSNHPHQLEEYYNTVEEKFKRAKVREYVYLTINGSEPTRFSKVERPRHKYWVCMSWKNDILAILEKLRSDVEHGEIKKLRRLLVWMRKLCDETIKEHIENLRMHLLDSTSKCLHAELNRLGEGKTGEWEKPSKKRKSITIRHSSCPKTPLYLELLPNLSITVQGRRAGKPLFEKLIVPYGSNTDQIYNLLDLTARDVYHYNFNGNRDRYLADKRRKTVVRTIEKNENESIFDFVSKNQHELKILFTMSQNVWQAQKFELQES